MSTRYNRDEYGDELNDDVDVHNIQSFTERTPQGQSNRMDSSEVVCNTRDSVVRLQKNKNFKTRLFPNSTFEDDPNEENARQSKMSDFE